MENLTVPMREENEDFENEVRRIARALWPEARYAGAAKIDGRERDGVFQTEECLHLIEATSSRKLDKAKADIRKLVSLALKMQSTTALSKVVRCWFVTRDEPTADQRQAANKHRPLVTVLSLSQLQSQLVDVRAYLNARDNYPFGSVRDPATGSLRPAGGYVPLALAEAAQNRVHTPDEVADLITKGSHVVLLGDYGAGKSMTLQHLYTRLCIDYKKGQTTKFPVYLNLRDHYGQTEPSEIIERHARSVGFESPVHLVRAWRAGNVHLILDGFDEITGLNIQGLWRKLRDNRYRAMEPVRRLIAEHPSESGLIVAGRAHFFDTDSERRSATGTIEAFLELSLSEFNEKQLQQYLKAQGIEGSLPTWLPSRPLLVAYLVSRGLMKDIVGEWAINADPASGWDLLLDRIADRESQIEAGIDSPTVRRILEKLATKARSSPDGLGPLTSEDIIEGFREVCGYPPDARGMLLLQRLPGLGIDQGEAETRRFIDVSFVEACRSGDVGHFAENPYDLTLFPARIECAAGPLGVAIAANRFRGPAFPGSKLTAAIERACALGNHCLAADLACATIAAGKEVEADIYIKDVLIRELEIGSDAPNASRIHFRDCFLGELDLDPELDSSWIPTFYRCFIGSLYGRVSEKDLPSQAFEECIVDLFATETGTTNQVLDLPFAGGVRVLITVLKKLFERPGNGRRENALYRGLDHRAKRFVPDVLQLLKSHRIAYPYRRATDTVWLPDRSARARVGRIIASPSAKEDSLVVEASRLE